VIRTKLDVPHEDECGAVAAVERGDWGSPWFWSTFGTDGVQHEKRDSLGRRGGSRRWVPLICNSTSCPGRLLVLVTDVEDAVHEAESSKTGGTQ